MAEPEMMAPQGEQAEGAPGMEDTDSVTITKNPDGTFTVGDHQCEDIDEALEYAKQALMADDGGMSVEQAFGQGFSGG
jgi:hypothetical protein